MTFRRLRDVRAILADLDEEIDRFATRRTELDRSRGDECGRLASAYLDRLCALLAEDLPHSAPPGFNPALRRN